MSLPASLETISGAQDLFDWFGYWPEFHDAEIVEVHLHRSSKSTIKIHTWQTTSKIDEKGFNEQVKHVVVEFLLENITGMNVDGFNHQNVISSLGLRKTSSGYILDLGPCYGFAGTIETENVSLRITPGKPV